ncbi:MAG TPA: type II toxin-antitoxin system RelE/ParE family toxin [Terracidiphilus sp.]|jgi:toxin ParE1/3/4|nr:type II toxin-antitoxin system RelE/ParE family toxin [Terracidiphilus sp.]
MAFHVRFTVGAHEGLRNLHAYISANDSLESADYVAREIIRAALTLRDFPNRGANPPELLRMGNRSYRQIFFKPYRILYRIRGNAVYIAVIADGRRDMALLLSRRMIRR